MKVFFASLIFLSIGYSHYPAFAHGPKGHGEVAFTALEAAKKGIQLYDQLVANGKLPESWETDLASIQVSIRTNTGNKEIVVQFDRSSGNPRSVYIFFTEKGEYNGSNFSGD
jgi:hypothetical protein